MVQVIVGRETHCLGEGRVITAVEYYSCYLLRREEGCFEAFFVHFG